MALIIDYKTKAALAHWARMEKSLIELERAFKDKNAAAPLGPKPRTKRRTKPKPNP